MAGVVWVPFYATLFRQDQFAAECAQAAELSLRYGATRYQVHRSNDDRYKITMMVWFESKTAWYRYWDGPEMIAFRRRNSGRFQIPVVYYWSDEIAVGSVGPEVEAEPVDSEPRPVPGAAAS